MLVQLRARFAGFSLSLALAQVESATP
jgi:hypothetical protein